MEVTEPDQHGETQPRPGTDNDGLWTAMYIAAECFRYKVTGETDARENARRGMQAILRLESITGIPGFPARSFIKIGDDAQPRDGWCGIFRDTTTDSLDGATVHYYQKRVTEMATPPRETCGTTNVRCSCSG